MSVAQEQTAEVDSSRIWLGGLVTIVLSVIGNLILVWLANLLLTIPPEFEPLAPMRITIFTFTPSLPPKWSIPFVRSNASLGYF